MNKKTNETGFTLIELLLVVVIIGILLAVIVPRAWRANVDAKYGLVRQNATELASFASQWAEQMMEAQDLTGEPDSGGVHTNLASLTAYFNSLTRSGEEAAGSLIADGDEANWIANTSTSNWRQSSTRVNILNRFVGFSPKQDPETSVEGIIPPERLPRNPFSGANVFTDFPEANVIPGAIACGRTQDTSAAGSWNYYALIFQGTDSTTFSPDDDSSFHAGMAPSLAGLRNGIFMARISADAR